VIVLDTNVKSEVAKAEPDPAVATWLRRVDPLELERVNPFETNR
jgi:predicted nucleic acid-binding protein